MTASTPISSAPGDLPGARFDLSVTIPMGDWNAANSAAEKAVTEIFTFDWKDYDKNVEAAKGLITDRFAKEYSRTAKATREKFVASKADYDVTVVGRYFPEYEHEIRSRLAP